MREVKNLTVLKHENIIGLEGYYKGEYDNFLYIINEYANAGDLTSYI